MEYTREQLLEARRQIDSTLHKLRETITTFEAKEEPQRYKSQITLAKRRMEAFTIANDLIGRELAGERQEACHVGKETGLQEHTEPAAAFSAGLQTCTRCPEF